AGPPATAATGPSGRVDPAVWGLAGWVIGQACLGSRVVRPGVPESHEGNASEMRIDARRSPRRP
ncbi:hypothetical protein, partial [Methylorubrum extorquens]|uniref:hypothetical protein n=1 Tax=Methylorubrum extorquens TaxID=408 RepID=UPI001AEC4138